MSFMGATSHEEPGGNCPEVDIGTAKSPGRRPTDAALFADVIKIDHAAIAELGHVQMMAPSSKKLTPEEFASLPKVANTSAVLQPPAVIPAEHSARLIGLGYMVDLDGRLRMTSVGRHMIAAEENQNRSGKESIAR
jgi:hypothetical protein